MKLSGCPVFTVKSVGLVALGVVVVGGVYVFYRKMTTQSETEEK